MNLVTNYHVSYTNTYRKIYVVGNCQFREFKNNSILFYFTSVKVIKISE
jgi:hypothetical protein